MWRAQAGFLLFAVLFPCLSFWRTINIGGRQMINRHAGGGPRVAMAVHTRPRPTRASYTKFVAPSLSQAPLIFKVCMLASIIGSTIWISVADSGVLRRMRANSPNGGRRLFAEIARSWNEAVWLRLILSDRPCALVQFLYIMLIRGTSTRS